MRVDIRTAIPSIGQVFEAMDEIKNIATENVEGDGAKDIATLWSSKEPNHEQGMLLAKLVPFLPKELGGVVEEDGGGLFERSKEVPESEDVAGSSDDEGDAHSQGWRAVFLGVAPESGGKVPKIEGSDNKKAALRLTDGNSRRKSGPNPAGLEGSRNGKRRRDKETVSTSGPSKKRRLKSPEVIVIEDSSPSPPPSRSMGRSDQPGSHQLPSKSSPSGNQVKSDLTPYQEKASELKLRMTLAKRRSNEVATFTAGESLLSAAWSQSSSKVISPSSREAEPQSSQSDLTGLKPSEARTESLPSNEGRVPSSGVNLNHAKSLLNQLIAGKGHWVGLSSVGSPNQTS